MAGAVGVDPVDECATSSAQSELAPVYLLFLLDQSASMGDIEAIRAQRWVPVTDAIKAFVSDTDSTGIYASLTFFPNNANTTTGPGSATFPISCTEATYATPAVDAHALPDEAPFSAAITEVDPPNEWGTPTDVALRGVASYGESLLGQGNKVAIVLVTDGEPTGCGDGTNPVDATVEAAAAVVDSIPTYVIGVGLTPLRLDAIAAAGGTETAFIIDLDNPDDTRESLLAQVKLIQGQQISCELPIPEPPAGETLDPNKVNVQLRADDEASTVLYNETCEDGVGWHYDNLPDPSTISLCDESCQSVQATSDAAVEVIFGCETKYAEPQ